MSFEDGMEGLADKLMAKKREQVNPHRVTNPIEEELFPEMEEYWNDLQTLEKMLAEYIAEGHVSVRRVNELSKEIYAIEQMPFWKRLFKSNARLQEAIENARAAREEAIQHVQDVEADRDRCEALLEAWREKGKILEEAWKKSLNS